MNRFAVIPVLLLLAIPAAALEPSADKNITMLANDLHALARVTDVAKDLGDSRQVLLAIVDSDVETLRMPRGDGTYQWASLQREEGGRVKDEKTIEHVHTEQELRYVTVTGANGYRVVVTACTGEVEGERPWSALKIAFAVVLGAIALLVALSLRQE